jgi:hypothetical protein
MGAKSATASSNMSVEDCGQAFQMAVSRSRGIRSQMGGLVSKVAGHDNSGFFTPTDNSPFSAVDSNKPTFMVGCNIPKFTNSAGGNVATIHMYVWDKGTHRDIEFYSPHGLMGGGSAAKLVRKILAGFQQSDPNLSVTAAP